MQLLESLPVSFMSHLCLDPSYKYTGATFPPVLSIRKAFWEFFKLFFLFSEPVFYFYFALLCYLLLSYTKKKTPYFRDCNFPVSLFFLVGIMVVDCVLKVFCFFTITIETLSLRISLCYQHYFLRLLP